MKIITTRFLTNICLSVSIKCAYVIASVGGGGDLPSVEVRSLLLSQISGFRNTHSETLEARNHCQGSVRNVFTDPDQNWLDYLDSLLQFDLYSPGTIHGQIYWCLRLKSGTCHLPRIYKKYLLSIISLSEAIFFYSIFNDSALRVQRLSHYLGHCGIRDIILQ